MNNNNRDKSIRVSQDPVYRRRRAVAGALVGALSITGAVEAGAQIKHAVNTVASNIHQAGESDKFSTYHLDSKLAKEHIGPASVTEYTIKPTDINPTQVANELGAKDTTLVSEEISGQVGGDHSMQPGETVVLPNDQLRPPVESVSANKQ